MGVPLSGVIRNTISPASSVEWLNSMRHLLDGSALAKEPMTAIGSSAQNAITLRLAFMAMTRLLRGYSQRHCSAAMGRWTYVRTAAASSMLAPMVTCAGRIAALLALSAIWAGATHAQEIEPRAYSPS